MNRAPELVPSLETWLAGWSAQPEQPEPDWLIREKAQARARLRSEPIPGRKTEAWRYSNPNDLFRQRFRPGVREDMVVGKAELSEHLVPGLDAWRLVLVNGSYNSALSDLDGLPEGVRVSRLQQVLRDDPGLLEPHLNRIAGDGAHLFGPLNTAAMDDGLVLRLAEGCQLDRPLEIVQLSLGGGEPRLIQPRHLILLEQDSRLSLIERYVSREAALYCTNNLMEIELRDGAQLEHHRLQEESSSAFHLTGLYLRLSENSRYRGSNLALGAAWSRTDIKANFGAPGAECEIDGLYLAGDDQLVDFHLNVEHGVPGCASREHFKGLVTGTGRAVLDGRIKVEKQAQKTDAHLKNANLLLSRRGEVDTKPQLEILADDVKCSHGATVGQIDANALFYLRSRGIPEAEAKRMLCLGFAGEIIERCGPEPLRNYIESRVAARLR